MNIHCDSKAKFLRTRPLDWRWNDFSWFRVVTKLDPFPILIVAAVNYNVLFTYLQFKKCNFNMHCSEVFERKEQKQKICGTKHFSKHIAWADSLDFAQIDIPKNFDSEKKNTETTLNSIRFNYTWANFRSDYSIEMRWWNEILQWETKLTKGFCEHDMERHGKQSKAKQITKSHKII